MVDINWGELAQQAVAVTVPLLPVLKVGGDIAVGAAGSAVWDVIKARFTRPEQRAALAAVVEEPDNASRQEILRGMLAEALHNDAAFREELIALLPRPTGVTQEQHISGKGNTGTQVNGSGNTITIR